METIIERIMTKTNLNYIEAKTLAQLIIKDVAGIITPVFVDLSEHQSDSANKRKVTMMKDRIETILLAK